MPTECDGGAVDPDTSPSGATEVEHGGVHRYRSEICPGDRDWFWVDEVVAGDALSLTVETVHDVGALRVVLMSARYSAEGVERLPDCETVESTVRREGAMYVYSCVARSFPVDGWLFVVFGSNDLSSGSYSLTVAWAEEPSPP